MVQKSKKFGLIKNGVKQQNFWGKKSKDFDVKNDRVHPKCLFLGFGLGC